MSSFAPEKHNDYAPNPVQQEFIRLCAEKYWYLAFADVSHSRPELASFALNEHTVRALVAGGKTSYFLEHNPNNQYYYDWLRRDEEAERRQSVIYMDIEKITQGRRGLGGKWLGKEEAESLAGVFERAARSNKEMRFIAVDERLRDDEAYSRLKRRLTIAGLRAHFWRETVKFGTKIFGAGNHGVHAIAKILTKNPERTMVEVAADDRATVKNIVSYDQPGVIRYGAAHFNGSVDNPDNPHLMGNLLRRTGKSLCVLEVIKDIDHWNEESEDRAMMPEKEYGDSFERPDAELFIENTPGVDHGIRIINPEFQPLYEQAVKNVQMVGLTPQDTTRQFLPS